jgi:hypothetical protein
MPTCDPKCRPSISAVLSSPIVREHLARFLQDVAPPQARVSSRPSVSHISGGNPDAPPDEEVERRRRIDAERQRRRPRKPREDLIVQPVAAPRKNPAELAAALRAKENRERKMPALSNHRKGVRGAMNDDSFLREVRHDNEIGWAKPAIIVQPRVLAPVSPLLQTVDDRPDTRSPRERPHRAGLYDRLPTSTLDDRPLTRTPDRRQMGRRSADGRVGRWASDDGPQVRSPVDRPVRYSDGDRPISHGDDSPPQIRPQGEDGSPDRGPVQSGRRDRPPEYSDDDEPIPRPYEPPAERPDDEDRPPLCPPDDRPIRPAKDDRLADPAEDDRPIRPANDDRPAENAEDDRPIGRTIGARASGDRAMSTIERRRAELEASRKSFEQFAVLSQSQLEEFSPIPTGGGLRGVHSSPGIRLLEEPVEAHVERVFELTNSIRDALALSENAEDDEFEMDSKSTAIYVNDEPVEFPPVSASDSVACRAESIRVSLERELGFKKLLELRDELEARTGTNIKESVTRRGVQPGILILMHHLMVLDQMILEN